MYALHTLCTQSDTRYTLVDDDV